MNLWSMFFASAAGVGLINAATISYEEVKSFEQQKKPVTTTDISGLAYQPTLLVSGGCVPYPAVDAKGDTSGGLVGNDEAFPYTSCSGSRHGSQVYGRAVWHRDRWAIMYTWYFPKNQAHDYEEGLRHDWANIVVWINNPEAPVQKILGVATSAKVNDYVKYAPLPPEYLDGNATKVEYRHFKDNDNYFDVGLTNRSDGEFRQLIMWDQMTDVARNALNTTDFGSNAVVPFNDIHFKANLDRAWLDK